LSRATILTLKKLFGQRTVVSLGGRDRPTEFLRHLTLRERNDLLTVIVPSFSSYEALPVAVARTLQPDYGDLAWGGWRGLDTSSSDVFTCRVLAAAIFAEDEISL
jgi:hypothetical protein